MTRNVVDLAASGVVLAGVKISERKSRGFPYGLYKVENMVAVAMLIFFRTQRLKRPRVFASVNGW